MKLFYFLFVALLANVANAVPAKETNSCIGLANSFTLTQPRSDFYLGTDVTGFDELTKFIPVTPAVFQLITHGRPGELFIDNKWMNALQIASFLKGKINKNINHINIYGCEFAKDKKGSEAVAYLEKNLGVSIAASTNITGKDGDWLLEYGNVNGDGFKEIIKGNLQDCYVGGDNSGQARVRRYFKGDDVGDYTKGLTNTVNFPAETNNYPWRFGAIESPYDTDDHFDYNTFLFPPSNSVSELIVFDFYVSKKALNCRYGTNNIKLRFKLTGQALYAFYIEKDGNFSNGADDWTSTVRITSPDGPLYSAVFTTAAASDGWIAVRAYIVDNEFASTAAIETYDGSDWIPIPSEAINYSTSDQGICHTETTPTGVTANPKTICEGESAILSGNCSSGTLRFYTDEALTNQVSATVSPTVTTTYYASCVTGACKSTPASVVVTVKPTPAKPILSSVTQPTCTVAKGSFTITNFSSSNTYTISPSSGVTRSTNTVTAPAGTYTVIANLGGCASATSASVTINAQPTTLAQPTLNVVTQPTCSVVTGNFTITNFSPSYTYTVSPSTGVTRTGNTITAPAGTYTVTATSGVCTSLASTSVTINTQPATCVFLCTDIKRLGAYCDFDGDGIINSIDIDDDNDGILDATESFSCYYTEGELRTITKVTSSFDGQASYGGGGGNVSYPAGSDLKTLHDKEVNNIRYFNFTNGSAVNGSNIFTLEFVTPVNLSGLTPNYSLSSNTAGKAVVKGSNDGTSWSTALTSATDVSVTTLKFAINTGGVKYKYYRIEATNSFSLDIWQGELTSFVASFEASGYPRPGNCNEDLDGDGIPNNLDLDSDGDGCPDVLEARVPGATKNSGTYSDSLAVDPANAAMLVGANGFKDLLETQPESGFANYSFSLAAYDATKNGCTDSDKDGINDLIDLDDDNDGILDANECAYADFSNAAALTNFNINGNAALETDAIKLTDEAEFLKGAAWSKKTLDLNANFEANFSVNLGTRNSFDGVPGADGIAFVLQSNSATQPALGSQGGDMGYLGMANGIAIEFDTWGNATYSDPTGRGDITQEHHVSINKTADQSLVTGTGVNYSGLPYTIEDGLYHDVRVYWNAATKNLRVFFDGIERTNLFIPDLVSKYLNNKSTVYWGFTAGTGLAYNLQKVKIKSMQQNFVCTADLDKDGIPNSLDLDSDGDGCSDAIEGGANFTSANLVNSNMPGGNSGVGYTGTSIYPVIVNLGNTVDANGIPVIATASGQSVGTSQNAAQQDASCTQTPIHKPDFGVTYVNVPLNGNVSTNDKATPGSKYGNPAPNSSNPSTSCTPTVSDNGSYTFTCGTPGVYVFQVPVCEPSPSTICSTVPLTITVLPKNDPTANPVANTDIATTKINTPVTIDVRANDKCQNGTGCTLSTPTIVSGNEPKHGTFNPTTGVYTPTTGFVGTDTLEYQVCDNQSTPKCATALVIIYVLPANAPGINSTQADGDYAQTPYNTPVSGNVKTNDTDVQGDAQTVTAQTTTVPEGKLVLSADGTYTFTPVNGFSGPVEFPYTTCDVVTSPRVQACANATLHILVEPNQTKYDPDFGVTYVNVPLKGNVSTNDGTPGVYKDPAPNPSNPSNCLPDVNDDGTYTFTCDKPGVYVFNVPTCQPPTPGTNCTTVPLTITVLDPNDPTSGPTSDPVANTDNAVTKINTPVTIDVRANDKCQNGTGCTLSTPTIVSGNEPKHGTFDPATGVYTPTNGFTGRDSLQYTVCDNQTPTAKCATAWVYIDVLPTNAPNTTQAADDYAQTLFNTPVSGNVKTNDTDAEGNTQTVTAQTTTVPEGKLVLNTDGTYTFTPVNGFSGPVDFIYQTCDNGAPVACASATLHILVEPFVPTKYDPDFGVTYVNVPLKGNVSTNDGTPGVYKDPAPNPSNPSNCLPDVNDDGTYTFTCGTPGVYVFNVPTCEPPTPGTNCTTVPLTITVLDPNDPTSGPTSDPVANTDNAVTKINTPVTIDVRANDKCQNGDGCTLSTPTIVSGNEPKHGIFNPTTGVYTPTTGFTGRDSLQYTVCDNQTPTAKCATAWVYIDVLPTNAPNTTQAADDYAQTLFNTPVSGNVKTNDTDAEGNTQTVTAQTATVPEGKLVLNTDGTYTFTPVNGFSGPVDFTYQTCDDGTPKACATATLHILVEPSTLIDLTPTTRVLSAAFIGSEETEREIIVDISEILGNKTKNAATPIQVRVTKSSSFTYSYDATATIGNDGSSIAVNNLDWELTTNLTGAMLYTLKPGKDINGGSYSSFVVKMKVKPGAAKGTANFIVTILDGSGSENNINNNRFVRILNIF